MTTQQELLPSTVGERLKQQRLAQKVDLSDVSKALGLDQKVLEAIEEDNVGHMAAVYRNGYIRSYAKYLKIPVSDIASMLEPTQSIQPALQSVFSMPVKRNSVDNWLRATSYVLASLLIGTLAWQFTHEAVRLTQTGSSLQTTKVDTASDIQQPSDSSFADPVNASIASFDNLQSNKRKQPEVILSVIPESPLTEAATEQGLLSLSVSADSWVEITDADGIELEMDLLRAGSEKTYQGQPPFRLVFGRASAVKLNVNGEVVDLKPYTKADVVQLTWPPALQAEIQTPDQQ